MILLATFFGFWAVVKSASVSRDNMLAVLGVAALGWFGGFLRMRVLRQKHKIRSWPNPRAPLRYIYAAAADTTAISLLVGIPLWLTGNMLHFFAPTFSPEEGQVGTAGASFLIVGWLAAGRWFNRLTYRNGFKQTEGTDHFLPGLWDEPGNGWETSAAWLTAALLLGLSHTQNFAVGAASGAAVVFFFLIAASTLSVLITLGFAYDESEGEYDEREELIAA